MRSAPDSESFAEQTRRERIGSNPTLGKQVNNMKSIEAAIMSEIPQDKCLHALAGVLIFGAAHFATWQVGIAAALIIGIVKEIFDHFTGGDVSVWDVVATLAGGLLGMLCFAR